jgi:flagellar basal body-associated protein FliL
MEVRLAATTPTAGDDAVVRILIAIAVVMTLLAVFVAATLFSRTHVRLHTFLLKPVSPPPCVSNVQELYGALPIAEPPSRI